MTVPAVGAVSSTLLRSASKMIDLTPFLSVISRISETVSGIALLLDSVSRLTFLNVRSGERYLLRTRNTGGRGEAGRDPRARWTEALPWHVVEPGMAVDAVTTSQSVRSVRKDLHVVALVRAADTFQKGVLVERS